MHNHDIIFDHDTKRIGLVSSNCEMKEGFIDRDYQTDSNNKVDTNTEIDQKFTNTCTQDVKFLRNVCIGVTITMVIIIGILVYIIGELRKNGRFLWMTLSDDIGKLFLKY